MGPKRKAPDPPATPGGRVAPSHAVLTPSARDTQGEDPMDDDCERCAQYIGTPSTYRMRMACEARG